MGIIHGNCVPVEKALDYCKFLTRIKWEGEGRGWLTVMAKCLKRAWNLVLHHHHEHLNLVLLCMIESTRGQCALF